MICETPIQVESIWVEFACHLMEFSLFATWNMGEFSFMPVLLCAPQCPKDLGGFFLFLSFFGHEATITLRLCQTTVVWMQNWWWKRLGGPGLGNCSYIGKGSLRNKSLAVPLKKKIKSSLKSNCPYWMQDTRKLPSRPEWLRVFLVWHCDDSDTACTLCYIQITSAIAQLQ